MARAGSLPRWARSQRGQASVELVGTLPVVLLVGLVVWQLTLAGHGAWMCANAARVGARAQAVGADPEAAVRSALPAYLERGLRVEATRARGVRVRVAVPVLGAGLRRAVHVEASARLGDGG